MVPSSSEFESGGRECLLLALLLDTGALVADLPFVRPIPLLVFPFLDLEAAELLPEWSVEVDAPLGRFTFFPRSWSISASISSIVSRFLFFHRTADMLSSDVVSCMSSYLLPGPFLGGSSSLDPSLPPSVVTVRLRPLIALVMLANTSERVDAEYARSTRRSRSFGRG